MIIASRTQFHIERLNCLNRILNVKAVVAAFNQEKALLGAFSVITNLWMEHFEALVSTLSQTLDVPSILPPGSQAPD